MSASQFISLLESKGLLDPEIIEELRRQVEQSKARVTPEAISRLLVENGQLTRFQATRLVGELHETLGGPSYDPSLALRGGKPIESPQVADHDSVEDLLPNEPEAEEPAAAVVVEEVEAEEVVVPTKVPRSRPVPSADLSTATPVQVAKRRPAQQKSPWESFGVFGLGFILLFLLIPFIALMIWFQRGSSEDAFKAANQAYDGSDYEHAAKLFTDFANNYSSDPNASQAKVKAVLARIRQDADRNADPAVAYKTANENLPTIANEAAMTSLRGEVTDLLLRIAEKFNMRAENIAKLDERKVMIDKLNQHMELVRDPRYVGTQERTQNDLRIRRIEEDQQRIVRNIQRGEDLNVAVAAMTQSITDKDVMKTYNLRRDLVRKYPQLAADTAVNDLLAQATVLQKDLVKSASAQPVVSNESPKTNVAADALLVSRKEVAAGRANGTTIFLRVKGSVLAMDSANGRVLWRQHIGRDWTGEPKRLSSASDSDVLVSFPEQGMLRRLSVSDGSLVWECKFDDRIVEPSIDGEDIFVSTRAGQTYCLDVASGQTRWGKKLPQPTEVGVGGGLGKRKRYVLGDHSNLYVMSRSNGQCDEVYYTGHNPGTIAVPPLWILNQLIVFENAGPDYSLMRVFTTNEEGTSIQQGQNAVRFKGHVVVEPQVDGRRLAVVTNLGVIAILDVEPNNQKEKVTKLVERVANEAEPKVTWPLMVGNDLWIASSQLASYQIQVSRQALNPMWQREDGDQFTARPQRVDDYIVHSRVVRGNLGVRVSAINIAGGDVVWESDIGMPVTSLSTDGKSFTALTSQGATYVLEPKSFANKPVDPDENLGRNQRSMLFTTPVKLKDNRIAVLNEAQGNQMLVIDPERKNGASTRMLALEISGALPSADPVAVGPYLAVPLNNAQLALIDPDLGKSVGTPFQPTVQAGESPKWLNPVLLSDQQTIVIADENRNMYKLATGKQLRSLVSRPLDRPIKRRLAVIDDVVVAVSSGSLGDQLEFFNADELKPIASQPAEGRFAWGPYSIQRADQSVVLALSDIEGLIACDATGKKLWSKHLDKIVLVGVPGLVESDCLIATTTGELIRISLADGSVVARARTGEPISGPPLILPKGVLVPCDEGRVVTVPMPKAGDASAQGDSQ